MNPRSVAQYLADGENVTSDSSNRVVASILIINIKQIQVIEIFAIIENVFCKGIKCTRRCFSRSMFSGCLSLYFI